MTEDEASALVPIAAELIGCVHDEGPDAVAEVLARVPGARIDALAVVLAAMVDPDATVGDLLAWTDWQQPAPKPPRTPSGMPPRPREHGTERGYQQHKYRRDLPACQPCRTAHNEHNDRRDIERRASRKAA